MREAVGYIVLCLSVIFPHESSLMQEGHTVRDSKKNVLPDDYFASLKVGDVLNNEQQNPLVWHQSWKQ